MRRLLAVLFSVALCAIPSEAIAQSGCDMSNICPAGGGGGGITHVTGACSKPVSAVTSASGVYTFTCTPNATNDAIVISPVCIGTAASAVSITAPGWTITSLSALTKQAAAQIESASFGALALNTSSTTFTVTFTGETNCDNNAGALLDEFTGNSTAGGTTTFDSHNQNSGTTGCTGAAVTPANNNDAVWFSCWDTVTAVGGGYTKGQDDGGGDWTQYKILTGGSGVSQNSSFTTSADFVLMGITINP